jgi:hypothetical protein
MTVDYGPLAALVGTWRGDKGMDVAPDPAGREENPYFETITFTPIGDVTNANTQVLVGLRYHQSVRRKSTGLVFHDQTGYWMWEVATGTVIESLLIPRAVGVLAGGRWKAGPGPVVLEVAPAIDDPDWGIVQLPFMRDHARTVAFRHRVLVDGDTLTYDETTVVDIYGTRFQHTDVPRRPAHARLLRSRRLRWDVCRPVPGRDQRGGRAGLRFAGRHPGPLAGRASRSGASRCPANASPASIARCRSVATPGNEQHRRPGRQAEHRRGEAESEEGVERRRRSRRLEHRSWNRARARIRPRGVSCSR